MRKTVIAFLVTGLVAASSAFAANAVRISQVYGGGGGATYTIDYVELFNSSSSPVDLTGWSIQYGSSTGTAFGSSSTNCAFMPINGSIPGCGYYLIFCGSSGGSGIPTPFTPDYYSTAGPAIGSTAGKIALLDWATFPTVCPGGPNQSHVVDQFAYGASTCPEGTASVALTNASTAVRNLGGETDTDNNLSDFSNPHPAATTVTAHNSTSGYTNPNCILIGACCLPPIPGGGCTITSAPICVQMGGIYMGAGVPCTPSPCQPVPASSTTWGRIKTIYR